MTSECGQDSRMANMTKQSWTDFKGCKVSSDGPPTLTNISANSDEEMRRQQTFPCSNPHNNNMQDIDCRIASFCDWPRNIRATIQELADAGLYCLGERDKTKCFYCNGGLENWEDDDDPFVEHAKFFPNCEYLLRKKGIDFVSNITEQYPDHHRQVVHRSSNGSGSGSGSGAVINMNNGTIIARGGTVTITRNGQTETLRNNSNGPSFHQTIIGGHLINGYDDNEMIDEHYSPSFHQTIVGGNYVQETIPSTNNVNQITDRRIVLPLNERIENSMRSELTTQMTNMGFSEDLIRRTLERKFSSSTSATMFQTAIDFVEALQREAEEPMEPDENNSEESHLPNNPNSSGASGVQVPVVTSSEHQTTERQIEDIINERRCKICLDEACTTVFQPCGHMCACLGCSTRVRTCPICRRNIRSILKVYNA